MKFITITGRTLWQVVEHEVVSHDELRAAGVHDDSVVRINPQGDIEVRVRTGWEVVGGLIGDFEHGLRRKTGLDWSPE